MARAGISGYQHRKNENRRQVMEISNKLNFIF